jgi:hypothetical protein
MRKGLVADQLQTLVDHHQQLQRGVAVSAAAGVQAS